MSTREYSVDNMNINSVILLNFVVQPILKINFKKRGKNRGLSVENCTASSPSIPPPPLFQTMRFDVKIFPHILMQKGSFYRVIIKSETLKQLF